MRKTKKARYDHSEIKTQLQKNGKFEFDATPSIEFLRTLYDTGYKIPEAVNDMIDNCLDAEANNIRISLGQKDNLPYFILADDGYGMDEQILCGSMVLGASNAELLHRKKGLAGDGKNGCFGNGKKSSIATFQGKAVILSKVTDGQLHKIVFDIEEMVENGSWKMSTTIVTPDDEEFFNTHTNKSNSGTVVLIDRIQQFKVTSISGKVDRLRKTVGETFRRSIWNSGKKFYLNNKLIEAVDPMSYKKPIDGKGSKSTIFSTQVFDDVKYIDDEGNERNDGWLKLTFYQLPKVDKGLSTKYGWGQNNSLFYILRNHRQIMAHQTLGILYRVSEASKLRIELEFGTELDRVMGINFTKTRVEPSEYLINKIVAVCKSEFNRFRTINFRNTGSTKTTQATSTFTDKFVDFGRNIKPLLPILPDTDGNRTLTDPKNDKVITGRKNKSYNKQDNVQFVEASLGEYACPFRTEYHNNGSKKIVVVLNVDHPLYTQYLNKDTDGLEQVRSVVLAMIVSLGYSKWLNIRISAEKPEQERFEQKLRLMEEAMGTILHTWLTSGVPLS